MVADLLMRREGSHLVPWDSMAEDAVRAIPDTSPVMVAVTRKRSVPHHRFYFGCLGSMAKAGAPGSVDALHNASKIKTGLVMFATMPNGEFMAFPDSTAFSAMDQDAFNAWFPKAVEFWKTSGLWNWISPDLRAKLEDGQREAA